MAEFRLRTIMDALPVMIFFVDRDERCRYHNLAFAAWCGRSAADIDGSALSVLVDDATYQDLKSHGMDALLGTETRYEAHWLRPEGGRDVSVKLLPYPVGAQATSGFYVFVTPLTGPRAKPSLEGSVGIGSGPSAAEDASEAVYREAMEQQITIDEDPREYLLRAMEDDQFILYEQKIERLSSEGGPAQLREILLRLREEEDGMLPPGGFLEVAESYDLMPAIDRWVIRKLLKSCASMNSEDRAWRMPLYCVNLSSATLRDRDFPNHVRAQLQHWGIAGRNLCFEINHQDVRDRERDIGLLMEELKPFGCLFTVDSFGICKVSFAPFTRLRFDFIKIDGSIISEILRDKSRARQSEGYCVGMPEGRHPDHCAVSRGRRCARKAKGDRRRLCAGIRHRKTGSPGARGAERESGLCVTPLNTASL